MGRLRLSPAALAGRIRVRHRGRPGLPRGQHLVASDERRLAGPDVGIGPGRGPSGGSYGGGRTSFVALFRSTAPGADATSAAFQAAIATTLAPALQVDGVTEVTGYAQTLDDRFISRAGDAAYVLIGLDVDEDRSIALVEPVEHALALPAGYTVALTGFGPVQLDSQRLSEADLVRAETVSLPIAALVLILVFGSLIAAGMPLLVAGPGDPVLHRARSGSSRSRPR